MTESQLKYLQKFVAVANRVIEEKVEITIDFDDVTDAAEWPYPEQQLQHRFECPTCKVSVDILGEYGSCPKCGKRNSGGVFNRKLNNLEAQITAADSSRRSDLLNNTVATFEAMANDLKNILVALPSHPERKKEVESLNFQDTISSIQKLRDWFGFRVDNGISMADLAFVNLMFKRRHLFVHSAGRVDQKHLDETADKTFDLHEAITVSTDDLIRLIPLVRRMGANLMKNVEEIA